MPKGSSRVLESHTAADKIARLLAILVVRDMDTDEAALKLSGVGFSDQEISQLLGVSTSYTSVVKTRRQRGVKKRTTKT